MQIAYPYQARAPRRRRYTFMPNGWAQTLAWSASQGGTSFLALPCPDDFYAVRVGFMNITSTAWSITKVIACASSSWNDYFNPLDAGGANRANSDWSTLTFAGAGADKPDLVTKAGAPTAITVAANSTDFASGETANPAITWTDWVKCSSVGSTLSSKQRVLMLRALVPSSQTVTYTNGTFSGYQGVAANHLGYDYAMGGIGSNNDKLSNPSGTQGDGTTFAVLQSNNQVNGTLFAVVQFMTKNAGLVCMTTGDSHHAGTTTTSQLWNYMLRTVTNIGAAYAGQIPVGLASFAFSGAISQQFLIRMGAALAAIQPSIVVLPGWTYNDLDGATHADQIAVDTVMARLQATADLVRTAGAIPIFLTPFPRDAATQTGAQLTAWQGLYTRIMAMTGSGEFVVDATSLLGAQSGGVFAGTYLAGLSTDNVHPNDAGHALLDSAGVRPLVRTIAQI